MKALDLNVLDDKKIKITEVAPKDIAIIGMAGKISTCRNLSDFWQSLVKGRDQIHEFPLERIFNNRDFLLSQGIAPDKCRYYAAAFLEEIDKFDYDFFSLSPKEASLMNPNQRLFLEIVWNAIEDAGYGGKRLLGSKTGIYVGFSSDFGEDYKRFIATLEPSSIGISIPGNIKSIIGSRISYLLDLKGPSIMIDTACSSALTAVHSACHALKNGECEIAIAGSVKINLLPIAHKSGGGIGIGSSDGRARSFDDSSDGTGGGEGVGAILLKCLDKALVDGDQIHAIIKGSAINQDGSSVGITAPNPAAQEDLITKAWEDAGINPETVTFIEAHGTGTKLGDPIEISGIQRAFRRYTTKKQFCAVGSVKTNVGHLDHAAGIAGLIKAVLALKHKEIPPSLHFQRPNRKIHFMDSPVYVNDRLRKWESDGHPRRCGVSAFGLSGTNCHVVLEEAPEKKETMNPDQRGIYLLALSAQYQAGIIELVKCYQELIGNEPDINLNNLCITANMGRGHYSHRLIVTFFNTIDLKQKLANIMAAKTLESAPIKDIYFGWHKIVAGNKEYPIEGEFTENEIRVITNSINSKIKDLNIKEEQDYKSFLEEICSAYIQGADIDWSEFYKDLKYQKISLPTYPFQQKRCWVESQGAKPEEGNYKEIEHPLLDKCIADSIYSMIYNTKFSVDKHWVLNEHQVSGYHVLPSTAYLEIAMELGRQYYPNQVLEFKDIVFISPLVVSQEADKDVQTIVQIKEDYFEFTIASKLNKEWIKHAEGKVYKAEAGNISKLDVSELKQRCREKKATRYSYKGSNKLELGPRWNVFHDIYYGVEELFVYLELPEDYKQDLPQYHLHPALMDCAANAASRTIGEGLYLPWAYQSIKIYGEMPGKFYSYVRRKNQGKDNARGGALEVATFDITLLDEEGKVFVEITGNMVKKVQEAGLRFSRFAGEKDSFYNVAWVPNDLDREANIQQQGSILVLKDQTELAGTMIQALINQGREIIEVSLGTEYCQINNNTYTIDNTESSYTKLIVNLRERNLSQVIHLQTINNNKEIESIHQLEESQQRGVYSLYFLTRALLSNRIKEELDIALISDHVYEVTGAEETINPQQASLFGLGKVVNQEYPKLHCRCIDIDVNTSVDEILLELECGRGVYRVAYRNGRRFTPEFQELDPNDIPSQEIQIQADGVYLITGGTGGIGLEFGKYLATKNKVKLALLSRSKFPVRKMWEEIVAKNEDQRLIHKITAIQEMEQAGAEVSCYKVDVSNYDEVEEVLDKLRRKHGRINGIIHSAGIAGDGFIINKDEEVFKNVLGPKVQGTWLLDQLTEKDKLDFFVMFSSINSLLGGMGQGDYTAANAFLDAYASYRNKKGKKTLTINWPAWKETGMAVDYGSNQDSVFMAITIQEALRGFDRVINSSVNKIFIGVLNQYSPFFSQFPVQVSQQIKLKLNKASTLENIQNIGKEQFDRKNISVIISGKVNNEYNDIERAVANIWGGVLGLGTINIYDSFDNLGGNSILAIKLLKDIEYTFPGMIEIADIFTYNTIKELAEYISKKKADRQPTMNNKVKNDNDQALIDKLYDFKNGTLTVEESMELLGL